MRTTYDYVIVGAGAAGSAAARVIRENAPGSTLLVISDEDRPPYHRTKLSKNLVHGFERDEFALFDEEFWKPAGITLLTNTRLQGIDPETHTLSLSDGSEPGYGKLLLSLGGRPRLPERYGVESEHLTVLRSAAEAEAILTTAAKAESAIVAGDGVLAVELSDQLAQRGLSVVLGTRTARLMQKRLSPHASVLLKEELEKLSVSIQTQAELVRVEQNRPGTPLPGLSVSLGGGKSHGEGEYNVDIAAVAYGIVPAVDIAEDAGIRVDRGILVDSYLSTSVPDVYAAGDCAQHPGGGMTGVWRAADAQGVIAALNMIEQNRTWDNPIFRLKFTANGMLFCTVNVPEDQEAYDLVECEASGIYQGWYCLDGIVKGVVMVNDPDRMQDYEDAVREGLELSETKHRLKIC